MNPELLLIHILKIILISARLHLKQIEGDAISMKIIDDSISESEKFLSDYCQAKIDKNRPFGSGSHYMN